MRGSRVLIALPTFFFICVCETVADMALQAVGRALSSQTFTHCGVQTDTDELKPSTPKKVFFPIGYRSKESLQVPKMWRLSTHIYT
jgi:hypothetical protein